MKTRDKNRPIRSLLLLMLAGLMLFVAGCETDDTTDPTAPAGETPDVEVAASLSAAAKAPATVSINIDQIEMFENPTSSIAADAGIYQDADVDTWSGEGVDYPDKSARSAYNFRAMRALAVHGAGLVTGSAEHVERASQFPQLARFGKDAGDTISVEYFDGPDSTGLNALIETDQQDIVRFVSQREYPRILFHVVRRDQEILVDTNGTLEDGSDDKYHSIFHEIEWFGGSVETGTMEPVSGSGPMEAGVMVRAVHHVEDPRFHLLQAWTEAEIIVDPGEIPVDGDEILYSLEATVHWLTDAEHYAIIEEPDGNAIEQDTIVRAVGQFSAAPANGWLESISDTLMVQLGDLEDEDDDLLIDARRLSVFDGTASDGGSPRSHVSFTPDEPVSPGEEPCGGEATQDVWYPSVWWVVHIEREADVECDGSGSLHVYMLMRDGSTIERTITWDGAGTASVTENRPDGTSVTGTFTESTGEYSLVTTYPSGHDPVVRNQHGQIQEGEVEAWEIVTWQDAHPDTTYFTSTGDDTAFAAQGYRVDGDLREDYTLTAQADGTQIGTWSRNDGATAEFTLDKLDGGGAHLVWTAESPAEPGEPSVEGEIWFAPDGSGTGTVTLTQYGVSVTFDIVFDADGTSELVDSLGKATPF